MIKSQIRKLGGKAIVQNKQSHQETFDELSQTKGVDRQLLAEELSKIPSSGKVKSTASLRYIFIACLSLLAILRILGVLLVRMEGQLDLRFLILILLLGLFLPAAGIYAAIFHKAHLYYTVGILLVINLFQSFRRGELLMEAESLIFMIPFAAAVFLSFYIPGKLKTPYKKSIKESYADGKLKKEVNYTFEDTRSNESDILDSRF